jgi:hypothetical protein
MRGQVSELTAPSRRLTLCTEKESKRARKGRGAHVDHAGEVGKPDAQQSAAAAAAAAGTSTDLGPQGAVEIAREMALGDVLDFDREHGYGGVCVGEDVAGAPVAAAASKQAQEVAAGGAIAAAAAAVGEEGIGMELSNLLAAESVGHMGTGLPGARIHRPWCLLLG